MLNEIARRYTNNFLEYEDLIRSPKKQRRNRREIQISNVNSSINSIPLNFFVDAITHYDITNVIFIFDEQELYLKHNDQKIISISTKVSIAQIVFCVMFNK